MAFNDDQPIVPTPYDSGTTQETFIQGKTKLTITKKEKAPLEESNLTVFLELTDTGFDSDRHGVDIVAFVDAIESVDGENLKKAMHFMINKLSPSDRLSIVTFANNTPKRLCPLTQMTKTSKTEITKIVHDMEACDGANLVSGLEMAAQVLRDRRHAKGRVGAIMVMSDGNSQSSEDLSDAALFGLDHVPIYTFGFGDSCEHEVLKAIAENTGGRFTNANVENTPSNNLSIMFSDSLGRLLNEDVKNLELTIRELDSKIDKVDAGSYPHSTNNDGGSTTIIFGNLYKQEMINLSVDLLLPAVSIDNKGTNAFELTLSYSVGENRVDTCRILVSMIRTSQVVVHDEPFYPKEQVFQQTGLSDFDGESEKIIGTHQSYIVPEKGETNKATKIFNCINPYFNQFNKVRFYDLKNQQQNTNDTEGVDDMSNEEAEKTDEKEDTTVYDNVATSVTDEPVKDIETETDEKEDTIVYDNVATSVTDEPVKDVETETDEKEDTIVYDNVTTSVTDEPVKDVLTQPEVVKDVHAEDDHQLPEVVNVVERTKSVIKNSDSEIPASMDLLAKHLQEAIESINAMQDGLNKFL